MGRIEGVELAEDGVGGMERVCFRAAARHWTPRGMWSNKREVMGVANGDCRFSDVGKIAAALGNEPEELIWNSGTPEQTASHHQKW
jgi:hypothetical protein